MNFISVLNGINQIDSNGVDLEKNNDPTQVTFLQKSVACVAIAVFSCFVLVHIYSRYSFKAKKQEHVVSLADLKSAIEVSTSEKNGSQKVSEFKELPLCLQLAYNQQDAVRQQAEGVDYGFKVESGEAILNFFDSDSKNNATIEGIMVDKVVGKALSQGFRDEMEDRNIVAFPYLSIQEEKFRIALYGVFDGHGGDDVSQFIKKNIQAYLIEKLESKNSEGLSDQGIFNALTECFIKLDDDCPQYENCTVGSTATVALIIKNQIWVANTGDSRTLLVKKDGQAIQATEDAKPTMKKYAEKIKKLGGSIVHTADHGVRVNGVLSSWNDWR